MTWINHRKSTSSSVSSSCWQSVLICMLILLAAKDCHAGTFSVMKYGAACNSSAVNGGGTDDTGAFTAAAVAANAAYVATGAPQIVVLPAGGPCLVSGKVTIGSGVVIEGPGTIVVPKQTGGTLFFLNADYSGAENLTITMLTKSAGNNADLSAISWRDTASDAAAHLHFFARSNTVVDANWGILVACDVGKGSLRDVDISGNTIMSSDPAAYGSADGIHVGGSVSGITISSNRVLNRGDAAIALSSEPGSPSHVLSGAVVSNNVCLEDLVGLDNSGATNAIWSNNYVSATLMTKRSNPAARSIPYGNVTPVNVKFIGNYLANYQSIDYAAKVDNTGSNVATDIEWEGNTFNAPNALYLAGNAIVVHDNVFANGASLSVAYSTPPKGSEYIPTQNILIGSNYWMGSGTIRADGNPGLYVNNSLAEQKTNGKITVVGQGNFRPAK
jgi:hypothetical protein